MNKKNIDVLIIGAGISGVGAAYYLQERCSSTSYVIVEARAVEGGTWDLFRYPGIRSDSDMYTFGFKFKPWKSRKAISPGDEILDYVQAASVENGIRSNIQFNHQVTAIKWSSESTTWACTIVNLETGESSEVMSKFVLSCGGYYSYKSGHKPKFNGIETFSGDVIHPQHWPEGYDYSDKKIVVIGSGATAVTLVPELAKKAERVTLLQRSPTYMVSRPSQDKIANFIQRLLPEKIAYSFGRWKNILISMLQYHFSKRAPNLAKKSIIKDVQIELGPGFDVAKDFTPSYNPWDQRICLVPDSDLFLALRKGSAEIVTDTIRSITADGVELASGQHIKADVIITATGLRIEVFSGYKIEVDGKTIDPSQLYVYKGMMLSDVPNFAFSIGYTNASWTLKSELVAEYVCRLINYMKEHRFSYCAPKVPKEGIDEMPLMNLSSSYIARAQHMMPKQGSKKPWRLYQNYILDRVSLSRDPLTDSSIRFVKSS